MYGKPRIRDYGDLVDLTAAACTIGLTEDATDKTTITFALDPLVDITLCVAPT